MLRLQFFLSFALHLSIKETSFERFELQNDRINCSIAEYSKDLFLKDDVHLVLVCCSGQLECRNFPISAELQLPDVSNLVV